MITLSAPETLANPSSAHRYKVQLVSVEQELDSNEVPVPVASEIVDVCVATPSYEAIVALLFKAGCLESNQIVSHWTPQDCDCF